MFRSRAAFPVINRSHLLVRLSLKFLNFDSADESVLSKHHESQPRLHWQAVVGLGPDVIRFYARNQDYDIVPC